MWYREVCWTQALTPYWLFAHVPKYCPQTWSNRWQYWGGGGSGNICASWRVLPVLLGCGFQPLSSAGSCLQRWKKGWQGKEEDEITAGELLWLSFHRAQWLKVNLEFCTLSDCPGVFSHQTSSCVPSRLELKLLFEFGTSASGCLVVQSSCQERLILSPY